MRWNDLRSRISRLDLQAKVVIVLVAVVAPLHLLVSLTVSQITIPVIEEELRMVGVHSASSLAEEIVNSRLFAKSNTQELEDKLRQSFFVQPNLVQVDVFKQEKGGRYSAIASTDDLASVSTVPAGKSGLASPSSQKKVAEDGVGYWEVWVPIKGKKTPGLIRVEVSLQSAASLARAVWKIQIIGAIANIIFLIIALSYFLRKTIANDRKLRKVESDNLYLREQLHEVERQLMTNEKLAVMGQLTASFAHEIGTPLNAVGGHLQLLQEELKAEAHSQPWLQRLGIVSDQLLKIENIVKSFLQSTAKPLYQVQLTDLNSLLEKTIHIVRPRIDSLHVVLEKDFDRIDPVHVVPLDIEQILLNLLNNSLDSIQTKKRAKPNEEYKLIISSRKRSIGISEWVELCVYDSGEGIARKDLSQVFKPFYTTKAVGEGTGLGLSICQEIAGKYKGRLEIESREGMWTKATFRMPYGGADDF